MSGDKLTVTDEQFCSAVWDALKGDHNDLRRQQIILEAHRSARTNTTTELVEALREIVALDQPIDIVDVMNPLAREAVEIAREALALHDRALGR